jgi:NADH-quinone oxidoreductase subunit J
MTLLQGCFFYLAAVVLVGSVLVVTRRSPVHSVLWMLLVFVHIAVLFVFLNAEFLAAMQIIIYAGAVLVLFLFVLMLLDLRAPDLERRLQKQWPLGVILATSFLVLFGVILSGARTNVDPGMYTVDFIQSEGNVSTVGKVLFSEFILPFEIASLILLVAILGAVVLAIKKVRL